MTSTTRSRKEPPDLDAQQRAIWETMKNPVPLHPDLLPYLSEDPTSGAVLDHPLLIQLYANPSTYGLANAVYANKRVAVEAAIAEQDWLKYVWLHERPYRLEALHECVGGGLSGESYWNLVGEVWIDSENIHQNAVLWKETWASDEPGKAAAMTDEEKKAYVELADETVVWRGTSHRESVHGFSWTTDKDKAKWFAMRSRGSEAPPLLVKGLVKRENVFATFNRRGESEIVCRRVGVTSVKTLKQTNPGRG